ncbi:hypothetical protein HK405_005140 [Cladochytrium tenue]|nr:hypothetical protein HK405_005140 [Cladochytrium tenue]
MTLAHPCTPPPPPHSPPPRLPALPPEVWLHVVLRACDSLADLAALSAGLGRRELRAALFAPPAVRAEMVGRACVATWRRLRRRQHRFHRSVADTAATATHTPGSDSHDAWRAVQPPLPGSFVFPAPLSFLRFPDADATLVLEVLHGRWLLPLLTPFDPVATAIHQGRSAALTWLLAHALDLYPPRTPLLPVCRRSSDAAARQMPVDVRNMRMEEGNRAVKIACYLSRPDMLPLCDGRADFQQELKSIVLAVGSVPTLRTTLACPTIRMGRLSLFLIDALERAHVLADVDSFALLLHEVKGEIFSNAVSFAVDCLLAEEGDVIAPAYSALLESAEEEVLYSCTRLAALAFLQRDWVTMQRLVKSKPSNFYNLDPSNPRRFFFFDASSIFSVTFPNGDDDPGRPLSRATPQFAIYDVIAFRVVSGLSSAATTTAVDDRYVALIRRCTAAIPELGYIPRVLELDVEISNPNRSLRTPTLRVTLLQAIHRRIYGEAPAPCVPVPCFVVDRDALTRGTVLFLRQPNDDNVPMRLRTRAASRVPGLLFSARAAASGCLVYRTDGAPAAHAAAWRERVLPLLRSCSRPLTGRVLPVLLVGDGDGGDGASSRVLHGARPWELRLAHLRRSVRVSQFFVADAQTLRDASLVVVPALLRQNRRLQPCFPRPPPLGAPLPLLPPPCEIQCSPADSDESDGGGEADEAGTPENLDEGLQQPRPLYESLERLHSEPYQSVFGTVVNEVEGPELFGFQIARDSDSDSDEEF